MSQALHRHYLTQQLSNTFADVFADSGGSRIWNPLLLLHYFLHDFANKLHACPIRVG